jgi:predicted small integral membrane protein
VGRLGLASQSLAFRCWQRLMFSACVKLKVKHEDQPINKRYGGTYFSKKWLFLAGKYAGFHWAKFKIMKQSLPIRASKILLIACVGWLAFAVAFNNVVDYQSNFLFVQHVMSMDTVFSDNVVKYRAITEPLLHSIAYAFIIFWESAVAILCLAGVLHLLKHIKSDALIFNKAKFLSIAGLSAGFTLWFFGFMVIGGEWFCMWQSPDWNGQESAFRFAVCILLVLIYVVQNEETD